MRWTQKGRWFEQVKLNGIEAEPGTFMGFMERKGVKVGLIVDNSHPEVDHHGDWHDVLYLRPAKQGEVDQATMPDPRSVAEHDALPRYRTPYGLARIYGSPPANLELARITYMDEARRDRKVKVARRRLAAERRHLWALRGD